jgi:chorismate synthase
MLNTRGEVTDISIRGRHDCSAIPRVVPVLKAMLTLALVDALLIQRSRERGQGNSKERT